MARYEAQIIPAEQLRCALGHIAMGRAVKPVFANPVFFVPGVGRAVNIGVVRDGVVKRGFKQADEGQVGMVLGENANGLDIGRVVRRREGVVIRHALQNLLGEEVRPRLAAQVNGLKSDRVELGQIREYACAGICEAGDHRAHRSNIVRQMLLGLNRAFGCAMGNRRHCIANPLETPLRENRLVGHVKQAVLKRRGAGICNENFHENAPTGSSF